MDSSPLRKVVMTAIHSMAMDAVHFVRLNPSIFVKDNLLPVTHAFNTVLTALTTHRVRLATLLLYGSQPMYHAKQIVQ